MTIGNLRGASALTAWPSRVGRRLAVPLEVDGLSLPVGTDVTPAMWLTHTRPEEYPEPYAFRPERFLENPPSTNITCPVT